MPGKQRARNTSSSKLPDNKRKRTSSASAKDSVAKKRKRSQAGKPKANTSRRDLNKSASKSQVDYKEYYISAKKCEKWRNVSESNLSYIKDIMNGNISTVLYRVSSRNMRNYLEVQDNLQALHHRIQRELQSLKVPTSRHGDLRVLPIVVNQMETMLEQNTDHIEIIQEEKDRLERLIAKQEKLKTNLQNKLDDFSNTINEPELHPLLTREDTDLLDIPALPSGGEQIGDGANVHIENGAQKNSLQHFMSQISSIADAMNVAS